MGEGREESLRKEKVMAKYIISFNPQTNTVMSSILQMRKVRPGKVKGHTQSHKARLDPHSA